MKNFTTFLLLFISTIIYSQKGAKIEFLAPDNTIDYGQVSKNDNILRSFEFKNTGDAPLQITAAESTVSYVIVNKPSMAIMPGKKGKIDVTYNSTSTGPIRKTITVESNAVNYPDGRVALKIKGEVL